MTGGRRGARKCSKCGKRRQPRFFTSPKGRVCTDCQRKGRQGLGRAAHLFLNYGLTLEDYGALLEAQGGACAICLGTRTYHLNVDHDHALGNTKEAVRGLLCRLCNGRMLPAAKDDPATLRRAADYLEYPPARSVLGTNPRA